MTRLPDGVSGNVDDIRELSPVEAASRKEDGEIPQRAPSVQQEQEDHRLMIQAGLSDPGEASRLFQQVSKQGRLGYLTSLTHKKPTALFAWAEDEDFIVRANIAMNPHCPDTLALRLLRDDPAFEVAIAVVRNPNLLTTTTYGQIAELVGSHELASRFGEKITRLKLAFRENSSVLARGLVDRVTAR